MGKLILKIFLCYWIAAGIVIVIADSGPHEQIHRPAANSALKSALAIHGRAVAQAYESQGCAAAEPLLVNATDAMYLASTDGRILCSTEPVAGLGFLISRAANSNNPVGDNFRRAQIVALAVTSASGKRYVVLLRSRYISPFMGLLPGATTLYISLFVTLLLALLLAVPIRRLRSAARHIASGQLSTRVTWGNRSSRHSRIARSDLIDELIVDFNHMASRLESLVDAQRLLFRDVSHELRSPLARLSVALELARAAGTSSMKMPLDRIEEEAARLNDLIGELLSLAHMETLQELTQPTSISLPHLVECMMPDIEFEAAGRHRQVIARFQHDCAVIGDIVLLRRAFENVVRNAIRYTPENGLVEIELDRTERDGSPLAVLRIADHGPGVPSDELGSILKPFYRVDKSRQRSTGGFGVGLAIAARAVKLHSGDIVARNRPGGGLIVEMTFPLALSS